MKKQQLMVVSSDLDDRTFDSLDDRPRGMDEDQNLEDIEENFRILYRMKDVIETMGQLGGACAVKMIGEGVINEALEIPTPKMSKSELREYQPAWDDVNHNFINLTGKDVGVKVELRNAELRSDSLTYFTLGLKVPRQKMMFDYVDPAFEGFVSTATFLNRGGNYKFNPANYDLKDIGNKDLIKWLKGFKKNVVSLIGKNIHAYKLLSECFPEYTFVPKWGQGGPEDNPDLPWLVDKDRTEGVFKERDIFCAIDWDGNVNLDMQEIINVYIPIPFADKNADPKSSVRILKENVELLRYIRDCNKKWGDPANSEQLDRYAALLDLAFTNEEDPKFTGDLAQKLISDPYIVKKQCLPFRMPAKQAIDEGIKNGYLAHSIAKHYFAKDILDIISYDFTMNVHLDLLYAGIILGRHIYPGSEYANKEIVESDLFKITQWFSQAVTDTMAHEDLTYGYRPLTYSDAAESGIGKSRISEDRLMVEPSRLSIIYFPKTTISPEQWAKQKGAEMRALDGSLGTNPETGVSLSTFNYLGVDWRANTLIYEEGNEVKGEDMSSWSTFRDFHMMRFAEKDMLSKAFSTVVVKAVQYGVQHCPDISKMSIMSTDGLSRITFRQLEIDSFIATYLASNMTTHMREGMQTFIDRDVAEYHQVVKDNRELVQKEGRAIGFIRHDSPYPWMRFAAAMFEITLKAFQTRPLEEMAQAYDTNSMLRILNAYGFLVAWKKCFSDDKVMRASLDMVKAEAEQNYCPLEYQQIVNRDPNWKPQPIPMVRDDLVFLPHQLKTAYVQERMPKWSILEAAAGAGKTILIITDILRRLKAGTKTAVVMCPNHLVSNYVEDANYVTEGKLNVIPVTISTIDKLGRAYFERMVQAKPTNTFFVVGYDVLKRGGEQPYLNGNITTFYYPYAEWVRSWGIDCVWLDESHFLKNDSARTRAVRSAIIEAKSVVLATGTFYPTRGSDIINQTALLDPCIFGTISHFEGEHGNSEILGEDMRKFIRETISKNAVVAKSSRKEWAALLPDREVNFHFVKMNANHKKLYNAVLKETLEEIKNDPQIRELMRKGGEDDEELIKVLETRLRAYLQRLETATSAPTKDKLYTPALGKLTSPAAPKVTELIKEHIAKKIPGKILIFCLYNRTVEAVYNELPADIKKMTLVYHAATKVKDRERFENDPKIKVMIGIENSMNTGINAQFASRLIRLESVFGPGQLEQGESRINRPNLKVKEFRDKVYMDWVLVDETYAVTKTIRLISKYIDAEKYSNQDVLAYQAIPDLDPIRLNLDNIAYVNSFEDSDYKPYLATYLMIENEIKPEEIKAYQKRNKDAVPQKIESGPALDNSGILKYVPYVPLGGLYKQDELGLYPLIDVLRDYEEREITGKELENLIVGRDVHTQFGEGQIAALNKNSVKILLMEIFDEQYQKNHVTLPFEEVFILEKPLTETAKIRDIIARQANLQAVDNSWGNENYEEQMRRGLAPTVDVTDPYEDDEEINEDDNLVEIDDGVVDVPDAIDPEDVEDEEEEEVTTVFDLPEEGNVTYITPCFLGDFYALLASDEDDSVDFKKYGFKFCPRNMYMPIVKWQDLVKFKEAWKKSGILAPQSFYATIDYLTEAMKTKQTQIKLYRHAVKTVKDVKQHTVDNRKKMPNDRARPYFIIQDAGVFVVINLEKTPAAAKIRNVKIPGRKWHIEESQWVFLSARRTDLITKVKQMIKDGLTIDDLEEVKDTISSLRNSARSEI